MKSIKLIMYFLVLALLACQNKPSEIQDIVVVGGGLMGSSAAWHLSDQGASVLLLERQGAIYNSGSSYGEARIARSNNRGNDLWSYLHNTSVSETKKLIAYLNSAEELSRYNIDDIYTTSPVTYVGRITIYDKLMASLKRQKVDYKIASTPEQGEAIFDVQLPDSVLIQREYNKHSGTINPKILIQYLHEAISLKNNEVRYQQQVEKIEKKGAHYELTVKDLKDNSNYVIKAKRVVSAAGPYTGKLLRNVAPYFESLINPQRVFLAFLKIKESSYHALTEAQKLILKEAYPVINSSTGTRDGSFFSMIEYYDNGMPIFKIGGHFQRSEIKDLDHVWNTALTDEEVTWSKNGTMRYFTLLKLPIQLEDLLLVDAYSCVYSLSKSEVPYVTAIVDKNEKVDHNFIVLGGMSGVGAKGAMSYGLIAANLMTQRSGLDDPKYAAAVEALGTERLIKELQMMQIAQ